jgi:hypothetical protein
MNKPRVFIFGNSHVSQFSGENYIISPEYISTVSFPSPFFEYCIMNLGPSTAYNFFWNTDYYSRVLHILEQVSPMKDGYVGLLLGEIDCRTHIGRMSHTEGNSRSLEEHIEEVVDRMFLCYLDLKKRGYKPVVFAVQPASTALPNENPVSPVYGTYDYRNRITRRFNTMLERKCRVHSIPFCSIFDRLMVDEVTPRPDIFSDYVHIKGEIVRDYYDEALQAVLAALSK